MANFYFKGGITHGAIETFDMFFLNLNKSASYSRSTYLDSQLSTNTYANIGDFVYKDTLQVSYHTPHDSTHDLESKLGLLFAGSGFKIDKSDQITGSVTGLYFYYTDLFTNENFYEWSIENISFNAEDLFNAVRTENNSDDLTSLEKIFSGNDNFYLSASSRGVRGFAGNDKIQGSDDVDWLYGDAGNDSINGGGGFDRLVGGLGKDTLSGGKGGDYFDYNKITESGITSSTRDVIKDFNKSQLDKIDLRTIDAKTGGTFNDTFSFVSKAPPEGTGNGRLWYANGILYGSADNDAAAEFSIQVTLTGISASNAADYILM